MWNSIYNNIKNQRKLQFWVSHTILKHHCYIDDKSNKNAEQYKNSILIQTDGKTNKCPKPNKNSIMITKQSFMLKWRKSNKKRTFILNCITIRIFDLPYIINNVLFLNHRWWHISKTSLSFKYNHWHDKMTSFEQYWQGKQKPK